MWKFFIMSEKSSVSSVMITPDGKTLCAVLSDGFAVYSINPFEEKFKQTENRKISCAVTLTDSPRVVYSGVEGQQGFSNKSVCVFDTSIRRPLTQIDCPEPIKGIYMLPKMFAISLKNEVRIYNFEPSGLYTQLRCANNEHAPCDFAENEGLYLVAMCGRQTGTLRVVSVEANGSIDLSISAHSHAISNIKFNKSGDFIATSSEHGTIIRVFNSNSGDKVGEFRRGSFSASIQSIAFSPLSDLVAITSSKNTLHVFKIDKEVEETKRSLLSWKIPDGSSTAISFIEDNSIIAATSDGNMYTLKYNNELTTIEQDKVTPIIQ